MGTFVKPSSVDINYVLPFIADPPDNLVWSITSSVNGQDTVTVDGYTDSALEDAYREFELAAQTPKIMRYSPTADEENFTNIDYVRSLEIRLNPKNIFVAGVLTKKEFYANASFDPYGQLVYSDLIVIETYDYVRDQNNFAISRTTLIEWITEAETVHPKTKTRFKAYNFFESIRETDRRRDNVINELKSSITMYLVAAAGMPLNDAIQTGQSFFNYHMDQIIGYKEVGEAQALVDSIAADSQHAWLDTAISPTTTLRQYIQDKLLEAVNYG